MRPLNILDDRESSPIQMWVFFFSCCLAFESNRIRRNAWFYHLLGEVTSSCCSCGNRLAFVSCLLLMPGLTMAGPPSALIIRPQREGPRVERERGERLPWTVPHPYSENGPRSLSLSCMLLLPLLSTQRAHLTFCVCQRFLSVCLGRAHCWALRIER